MGNFDPGKAFWIISRDAKTVDTGSGTDVSGQADFAITLTSGFSQIGNLSERRKTMKHNLVIKVLLVAIVILLAVNLIRPLVLSSVTYAARRIQYKVVKIPHQAKAEHVESLLNNYGKDGWELVVTIYWDVLIFKK